MVAVGVYMYPDEAMLARAALESADIACFLENEYTRQSQNAFTQGGGLRLMVAASDLELAQQLLASGVSDEELTAQAEGALPEGDH